MKYRNMNDTVKYKGSDAPAKSGLLGVKQVHRGVNKGKFQAFYNQDGKIFTGPVRDSKLEALLDASLAQKGKRLYV